MPFSLGAHPGFHCPLLLGEQMSDYHLAFEQQETLEIRNTSNAHVLRVGLAGFPDLGIWSAANDGPFVCIEPWFGVDSTQGGDASFENKEGLVWLDAGKTFDCAYDMSFFKEE